MMRRESDIIPYHVSKPPGERVIVIAPHPDDETLGCGGTLRLLIETGKKIKVVFLTSGDKADPSYPKSRITEYALLREREAERALRILGVTDCEFLRFPDRGVHEGYEDVLGALLKTVGGFAPDTIYAPSMVELNPDHRTTAALAMKIQRMVENRAEHFAPLVIVFYEVATPLRPNMLVDITSVYGKKKKAIKKYKSQLRLMDYMRHITAMNSIRALTVSGPRYVEAFWSIDRPMSDEQIAEWLSYREILKAEDKGQG